MSQIAGALSDVQLARLREGYSSTAMTQVLSSGIPNLYSPTSEYIGAIRSAFYDGGRQTMAARDRERCLIAVLAARDAGLNLALHIYVGLMEGLAPEDIADAVFLGGIYTGVDRISDGLNAELRTLGVLAQAADDPDGCEVMRVVQALQAVFRPPPPNPAPGR